MRLRMRVWMKVVKMTFDWESIGVPKRVTLLNPLYIIDWHSSILQHVYSPDDALYNYNERRLM